MNLNKLINNRNILIFLSILTILIYSFSIKGDFSDLDDMEYINSIKKLDGNFWKILDPDYEVGNYYHPLFFLSLFVDYLLWNLNPAGFYLTSLLLFLLTLWFIYFFTMKLYNNRYISFITSLLFAIHPVHVEVVCWISSRTHVLGTFFLFLSFYFFILSREPRKNIYYVFSLIFFIFSILCNILMCNLALLLCVYIYCFISTENIKEKICKFLPVIPYFIFLSLFVIFLSFIDAYSRRTVPLNISFYEKILTFIFIFAKSCMLLLWPFNLSFIYPLSIQHSVYTLPVLYLLITPIIFIVFFYSFLKDKKLFFPFAWFVISYLPVSMRIFGHFDYAINDRYLYVPSFGFFLFFALISYRLLNVKFNRKLIFYTLHIFITVILVMLTVNRVAIWHTNFSLWADTLKKAPSCDLPHLCMALEYDKINLREEAIREYKETLAINPYYQKAHINLAANLYMEKSYDEAIYHTREALKLVPDYKTARELLQRLYREKLKESAGSEDKVLEIYRRSEEYLKNAEAFEKNGKYNMAEDELEKVLKINPYCEEAYVKLAILYKEHGNMEKYRFILLKCQELFPYKNKDIQTMTVDK